MTNEEIENLKIGDRVFDKSIGEWMILVFVESPIHLCFKLESDKSLLLKFRSDLKEDTYCFENKHEWDDQEYFELINDQIMENGKWF